MRIFSQDNLHPSADHQAQEICDLAQQSFNVKISVVHIWNSPWALFESLSQNSSLIILLRNNFPHNTFWAYFLRGNYSIFDSKIFDQSDYSLRILFELRIGGGGGGFY